MSTPTNTFRTPTAVVTGGSAGLGAALVRELAARGWQVVTDARRAERLDSIALLPGVIAVPGDVRDPRHHDDLAAALGQHDPPGRLDLLVHNASELGPMRLLADTDAERLRSVLETNLVGPLLLTQRLLPALRAGDGRLVGISSDAAVEHYPTWGSYAASKAALDHLVLTLGEENGLRAFTVDPGDMRTEMHQQAFPGEDISDRPLPEAAAPGLLDLVTGDRPSGRYRIADLPAPDVHPRPEGAIR